MIHRRSLIAAGIVAGALPATRTGSAPVPASGTAPVDEAEARLHTDWAWLGRYAEDNHRLLASGRRPDIVFLGDSITEGWRDKRPAFFTPGRVNRGIGGQTTPQMLVRTMADVVALRPRVLHLMAGTNDIAGNTGPMTVDQTQAMLTAICRLAQSGGIAVLLASVPPARSFPWRPGLDTVTPIRAINAWARATAPGLGATFVDYTPALADADGAMRPGLAYDGVHPTAEGYVAMAMVIGPVLSRLHA